MTHLHRHLSRMKRRHLLKQGAIAITSGANLAACDRQPLPNSPPPKTAPVLTQPTKVRWRMVTSFPKMLRIHAETVETICRKVSAITHENFAIIPYPADEIVKPLEVFDSVQSGMVECGYTDGIYVLGKSPALTLPTTLPFGFNFHQHQAWLTAGGGLELTRKLYRKFGLFNFPAGSTGVQMGGWFKQEIKTLEDLRGLKMRIPGVGGEIMKKIGVDAKLLSANDIFAALEQGDLDAAEFVGPFDDESLGLNRIATYYYYPGWWEPSTTLQIVVNLDVWESLPPDYQQILQSAVAEAHGRMISRYEAENSAALERLTLQGTQFRSFSPDILKAGRRVAYELYDEFADQDPLFREIYTSWKNFRDQIYPWSQLSEISFERFTFNT